MLCASSTACAGSAQSTSVRALLEHEAGHEADTAHDEHDHGADHAGHVEPAANEGEDGEAEGHGEGAEDHPGHVAPAPDEGVDDGVMEGHGEGRETGEGADGQLEGGLEGGEGLDGELEGGNEGETEGHGEGVAKEASTAWALPAPLAVAAATAALIAGM